MRAEIVIQLKEDGKVYVTGPLEKKELCIAMIEEAKQAVQSFKKTMIIVPPSIKDLKQLKK